MKNLKLTLLFIFLSVNFLFIGCAHQAVPSNFSTLKNKDSKNGLIIGSISFPKNKSKKWDRYFFHLKFLGEKVSRNSTEIDILTSNYNNTKRAEMYNTYFFAIKRIEGKYEMNNVRLFTNGGYIQYNGNFHGFSIPFEVKADKVTYIGQIIYDESAIEKKSVITLKDNFEEDINYFKNNNSKIDWENTIKSPITINYESPKTENK